MQNNEKFYYSYAAPTEAERKEIDGIRRQYEEKAEESKLDKLRRLDKRVKASAAGLALTVGIVGCLVFGLGITMVLEWELPVWGALVALVGGIPTGLAYFVYRMSLRRNKRKYGEEILRLSKELLQE